jgi:hypothetical protein
MRGLKQQGLTSLKVSKTDLIAKNASNSKKQNSKEHLTARIATKTTS